MKNEAMNKENIVLALSLVAFLALAGCLPADTNKLPEAPKAVEVPEYLGMYLTDGGKLTRLDANNTSDRIGFSPKTAVIVFHQAVTFHGALGEITLLTLAKVRWRIKSNGNVDDPEPAGGKVWLNLDVAISDLLPPEKQWLPLEAVTLLAKPMTHANMIMLVPFKPLKPGRYRIGTGKLRASLGIGEFDFTVGKGDGIQVFDKIDESNYLLAADLDSKAEGWETEINGLIKEAESWKGNIHSTNPLLRAMNLLKLRMKINPNKELQDQYDKSEREYRAKIIPPSAEK